MMNIPKRWPCLLLAFGLTVSVPARGDETSDKATARELFHRAGEEMVAGDYAAAAELYERSNAIFPAPTAVLGQARALVKLGKLLSAAERYNDVMNADLGDKPSKAFREAVEAARSERELILPRVPALLITLDGEAEALLDGEPLPDEGLGVERLVNPGDHVVSARRGGEVLATREVTVAEGKVLEVPLSVPPPEEGTSPVETEPEGEAGAAQRITSYALLGLGGAASLAFAVTGGLYLSAKGTVDDECDDDNFCSQEGLDAVDRARAMGTGNTVSLVVALVATGAGLTLLLTAPDDEETAALLPFVSPSVAGLAVTGRY
jgi:hypothetical protein